MLGTVFNERGNSYVNRLLQSPLLFSFVALGLATILYIIRQRWFHQLSRHPGPFVASFTNLWKTYHTYRLDLHEAVLDLHFRYGPVVRIGPKDLHFWDREAVPAIYKAGRSMPKTEFYDSFTTFNPNIFGTTDEKVSTAFGPNDHVTSTDACIATCPPTTSIVAWVFHGICQRNGTDLRWSAPYPLQENG
jgi:hypothetical protein